LKSLHGRKIAVDASMAIYQFLIAVRSGGPGGGGGNMAATMLTNADGETTSHIQGMFNRTIRFLTEGLKPVYIFDGKPPEFKSHELQKRREKRQKAQAELEKATETGNIEEQDKQSKRLVRAGTKENDDCQKLLRLMGVPVVVAPCEAEAQAAALARTGQVYATATEDMDALTFQTPILLRKMTFANQSKSMVQTMNYAKALEGLDLTHDQFVDLCILLGCDYCDTIRGVGPKTALKLLKEHGSIEGILKTLDTASKKFVIPPSWIPNETRKLAKAAKKKKQGGDKEDDDDAQDTDQDEENDENKPNGNDDDEEDDDDDMELIPAYVQARKLFLHHEVVDKVELKWTAPQTQELMKFLVDEQGFNAERVKSSLDKLEAAHKANSKPQARMDSFFAVKATNPEQAAKRKIKLQQQKDQQKASNKKAKKSAGPGRKR
jgi:flap endonuclease-1